MTAYIPWVALALALALFFFESRREKPAPVADSWLAVGLTGLFVFGVWATLAKMADLPLGWDWGIAGFALAIGFSLASRREGVGSAVALAAFVLAFNTWHGAVNPGMANAFAMVLGGVAAVFGRVLRLPGAATGFGLAVIAGSLANSLGAFGPGGHASLTGAVLGLAAVLGACVRLWGPGDDKATMTKWGAVIVFAIAAGVIGKFYLAMMDTVILALAGIAAAVISAWNLPEGEIESNPFKVALLSLLWLGLATFAFSLRAGYGMAVVGSSGVLTCVLLGNLRPVAAMTPLLALTAYRAFREIYPDESRAFDIGQHYAMVGLIAGVTMVVAAQAFCRDRLDWAGSRRVLGASTAHLLLVVLAIFAVVFLGSKGVVGLMVGLGIAPLLAAIAGRESATTVGLGGLLIGVVSLAHQPLIDYMDVEKSTKQTLLLILVIVAGLLAATAWYTARPTSETHNEPA